MMKQTVRRILEALLLILLILPRPSSAARTFVFSYSEGAAQPVLQARRAEKAVFWSLWT